MRYTKSQTKAIHHEGENILVSASAGSGKTGVLKARVLRKIHDGIDIDQLIVLTFTEAAAAEMKSRIIKELNALNLTDQLIKINNAIISTFDAFTLRLVKQYHYLLDLPSDISISDALLIEMASDEVVENVIKSYYEANNPDFNQMIELMFQRGDDFLKSSILALAHDIKKQPQYHVMMKNYQKNYDLNMLDNAYGRYFDVLKAELNEIYEAFYLYYQQEIGNYRDKEDKYLDDCLQIYHDLARVNDMGALIAQVSNFSLPRKPAKPKGEDVWLESNDVCKKQVSKIKEELSEIHFLDGIDYQRSWQETLPRVNVLMNMTMDYINQLDQVQKEKQLYSFPDIMAFAIQLLEEHNDIRNNYQTHINEILIDEYQDTNDLQDYFISLIANQNIFMVGDVKQSIYRFRDANPKNFLRLLQTYQISDEGEAIRLLENFRSNRHLLSDINKLFLNLMLENRGGVDYSDKHQLVSGYDETNGLNHLKETIQPRFYDLESIRSENEDLTKEEIEAMIVGQDIIDKINHRQQVFTGSIHRDIQYSDITILVDRKTSFETYRKVFSNYGIPVDVYNKTAFSEADEIIFIAQYLQLLYAIKYHELADFKTALYAVARSFVYQINDQDIIHFIISENASIDAFINDVTFKQIVKDLDILLPMIDNLPNVDVIDEIYRQTKIYALLVFLDHPSSSAGRLDYFRKLVSSQKETNFKDLIDYLSFIEDHQNIDIEYKEANDDKASVKLMSIHASKGLQFPVVYMMGLYKGFNFTENKAPFNYSKDYGILTYAYHNGFYRTFLEKLYFREGMKENISEQIRLLYVAMTRAKEEIVLILEAKTDRVSSFQYNNYQDMLYDGYGFEPREIIHQISLPEKKIYDDIQLVKDPIKYLRFSYEADIVDEQRYSKQENHFFDDEVKAALAYGDEVHQLLEGINYEDASQDLSFLPTVIQKSINHLKQTTLFKTLKSPTFYQEYEFIDVFDGYERNGVIDLLILDDDKVVILDYKLKHIDENAYLNQLQGYKSYLEKRVNMKIEGYLYSLIDHELKQLF